MEGIQKIEINNLTLKVDRNYDYSKLNLDDWDDFLNCLCAERPYQKELIKQCSTIWHDDYRKIELNNECEICEGISFDSNHQVTIHQILHFSYYYNNEKYNTNVEIDELEEDVENAEWHYDMDAQRVEKLILPSWKDLEKKKEFFRVPFIGKDGALYGLCVDFEDKWCGIDIDGNCEIYHIEMMTKENYTHICDICRKLFLLGD